MIIQTQIIPGVVDSSSRPAKYIGNLRFKLAFHPFRIADIMHPKYLLLSRIMDKRFTGNGCTNKRSKELSGLSCNYCRDI